MKEDIESKNALYLNDLAVKAYFLFDPLEEYLDPSMQGFRRIGGRFVPIRWVKRRLPSRVLGLHLGGMRSGSFYGILWDSDTSRRAVSPARRTGPKKPDARDERKLVRIPRWKLRQSSERKTNNCIVS